MGGLWPLGSTAYAAFYGPPTGPCMGRRWRLRVALLWRLRAVYGPCGTRPPMVLLAEPIESRGLVRLTSLLDLTLTDHGLAGGHWIPQACVRLQLYCRSRMAHNL